MFLALPGPSELWVVLVLLLLVFGARKLPELARAMGSSLNQFKKGLADDPDDPRLPGPDAGADKDRP